MTKKVRVTLHGPTLRKSVKIDAHATEGATLGLNLFWSDGTIVTDEQLRAYINDAVGDSIVIPPGPGVVNPDPGVLPPGDAIQLIVGTPGEIVVVNGDGVGGNPTISIDPNFAGGGGVLTDWPVIKDFIGVAESFTIPVNFQMLVWESFDVQGTLTVDGKLVIIGDQDTGFVQEYVASMEEVIIPYRHQMLVAEEYDIEGTLDNEGTLAIL